MMKIRKANNNDIESIILLWVKLMEMHEGMNDLFTLAEGSTDHFRQDLKGWLENEKAFVFVAETDNKIAGYTIGWVHTMPWVFKSRVMAYVNDIWVEEEYRSKGVGGMLMDEVRKYCKEKNIDTIDLSVAIGNDKGLK